MAQQSAQHRSGAAVGFTYFAAVMLILGGGLDLLQGLAAVIRSNYFVVTPHYAYTLNASGWGWIHMILGVIMLLAGAALLNGSMWARTVGVIFALLVAITNFMWLPYQPVWSIIVIALCILVVWALTVHGRDVTID
jgi:hypothetical protein